MVRNRPVILLAGMAIGLSLPVAHADVRDVSMTIGQGWALVKEIRRANLVPGTQRIQLDDIPAEADLSTLRISAHRFPVRLIDWHRKEHALQEEVHVLDRETVRVKDNGDCIWWLDKPDEGTYRPPSETPMGVVDCVIEHARAGEKPIEVSYIIRDFHWQAHYALLVRGAAQHTEDVSVDLEGYIKIYNPSSRSFDNVLVHLVGPEKLDMPPRREPGILLFKDSPLADFWEAPTPDFEIEHAFRLPQRVSLSPWGNVDVALVEASRIRARAIYYLDPLHAAESELQRMLVLQNTAERELGWRLPPGRIDVYQGSLRNQWLKHIEMPFTDVKEELRIALGHESRVRAVWSPKSVFSDSKGLREESYEVAIQNMLDYDISVQIREEPPPRFEWKVVRSTEPYIRKENYLLFSPDIPEHSETIVKYKIRYKQPGL